MQTYSFISQKGGAGKSTLARQLAVLAGESGRAVLIDRDAQQGTTTKWWGRRQALKTYATPELLTSEGLDLTHAVAALKPQPGTLLIDTRPAVGEPEAEAARASDLIVIPVRPSSDDLEAVIDTLKMVRRLAKPAVLVVNAAKNEGRALAARAALAQYPFRVCPHHLTDRAVYLDAAVEGRGVSEMKGPAARDAEGELRAVWAWIQEAAHG